MVVRKRRFNWFGGGSPRAGSPRAVAGWRARGPALLGGRPTQAAGAYKYTPGTVFNLAGRPAAWRSLPIAMLKEIRNTDPDVAMGVWNYIRLCSRIERIAVLTGGRGQDQEDADPEGQFLIDNMNSATQGAIAREYGGGFESLAKVFVLSLLTHGALAVEVSLAKDFKNVDGVFPVDPTIIDFEFDENRVPYPVISSFGGSVRINENQFRYIPLDPDIEEPRGRGPLWPTLAAIEFKVEVLRDLKAVAHNQGHARIDVSVAQEIVLENLQKIRPELAAVGADDELRAELNGFLTDLQTQYNALHPDDAFIHWDAVKVASAGANHTGSINIDSLMEVIDRQVVASLKTLPILIGRNDSATTTHATVQWQIFALTVEAMQDLVGIALEWVCNLALQINGRQSIARVEFERPRKGDRLADAQADKMETETWALRVQQGWADAEEAAQAVLGHAPPEPVEQEDQEDQEDQDDGAEDISEEDPEDGEQEADGDNDLTAKPWQMGRLVPMWPALARQYGIEDQEDHSDEAAELFMTPPWMQWLVRNLDQGLQVADEIAAAEAYQALMDIPDEEWNAAMESDGVGDNGRGRK